MNIPSPVLALLANSTVDGRHLRLPPGRVDAGLYRQTNQVLTALGGKWTGGRVQAHVFASDPTEVLRVALSSGTVVTAAEEGFFRTPPDRADELVFAAAIQPGQRVLEPSAGDGALVEAILRLSNPGEIVAIEFNESRAQQLTDRFRIEKRVLVAHADFTRCEGGPFDRVVMNPPFADGQDIAHVTRAFGLLAPGGRLVGIMSAGVRSSQHRAAKEFRALVDRHGGTFTDLPEGSFKSSGTNVRTCHVVIDAEGKAPPVVAVPKPVKGRKVRAPAPADRLSLSDIAADIRKHLRDADRHIQKFEEMVSGDGRSSTQLDLLGGIR